MGIHVEITGQGCRELEGAGIVKHWPLFADMLVTMGASGSRLDLANDDFDGHISLDEVKRAWEEKRIVSRFDRFRETISGDMHGKLPMGRTIYFGSPMSETQIRIYDKAAEAFAKASGSPDSPPDLPAHWVRVEVQFRGKRAHSALKALAAACGMDVISRVLAGLLEFKEQGTHSQRERWPVCRWWSAFLQGVSGSELGTQPVVRTVEAAYMWVRKQVAPTLAMLMEATRGDLSQLLEAIEDGRKRMRASHRAMLAALEGPGRVST